MKQTITKEQLLSLSEGGIDYLIKWWNPKDHNEEFFLNQTCIVVREEKSDIFPSGVKVQLPLLSIGQMISMLLEDNTLDFIGTPIIHFKHNLDIYSMLWRDDECLADCLWDCIKEAIEKYVEEKKYKKDNL